MRILMVGFDAPWIMTGYASTLRSISKELIKRGHEIFTISGNFHFTTDGPISHDGMIVLSNKGSMYPTKEQFLKHYNDVQPDVVIGHNDFYRIKYFSTLDKSILDKSILWIPIEDTDYLQDVAEFQKLTNLAFVTKYGHDIYSNLLIRSRCFQINHQIGEEFISPESIDYSAVGDKFDDKFKVLRVDRNQERKKWSLTLKSFELFIKKYYIDDAVLLAKTNPKDIVKEADLSEMAKNMEIEDKIHFIPGNLSTPQLRGLYEKCDIFYSTTGSEGFGLSIAEAMSCGKPVIVTGCAPIYDVAGKGAGSFIRVAQKTYSKNIHLHFNDIDIEHGADLLYEYYQDWKNGKKRIIAEGKRAKHNAQRFKIEKVVDKFEEVFDAIQTPYDKVLISIATKNRETPLVALLTSIFNQTYKNYDVFIFDNSDNENIIYNGAFNKQMELFRARGHQACIWKNNPSQNAPDTHQKILEKANELGYEYVFKIDDDCILENDALERLMGLIQSEEKIGAVSCPILDPSKSRGSQIMPPDYPAQTLENLFYCRQWSWKKDLHPEEVEHLHSSFIYRTEAMNEIGGFPSGLSKVAFREETLSTYPMFLNSWKLIYDPNPTIWHMKSNVGGCRDNNIEALYMADEEIFKQRLENLKKDKTDA